MIKQFCFGVYTQRIEDRDLSRYLHTRVHSSVIHNSPKVEAFEGWIGTQNVDYTMEFYSALNRKEILTYAGTWLKLEDIMLIEMWQKRTNSIWFPFYEVPR